MFSAISNIYFWENACVFLVFYFILFSFFFVFTTQSIRLTLSVDKADMIFYFRINKNQPHFALYW